VKFRAARKLFSVALCALSLPLYANSGLQIKTAQGKVEGKMSPDGQVRVFLGIPFAAPPVGPLRWKPPQPAAKWSGVRQTTAFGDHCMQSGGSMFRKAGQSEDCLTLNVWTPAGVTHGKLPVMVWIYGGGFSGGATSEARQDGTNLTRRGVVVVSMNYRLGILGFFALRELAEESPSHAAGNYGLMDQTAALRWVQSNIARFGGDPKNATIFGQSAGSVSVSAQMASPLAQGLFARAIGESGGALARLSTYPSLAQSEQQDEDFAQRAFGSSSLAALRAVSADDLISAAVNTAHARFATNVDGLFLPESVPAIFAEGRQAHVPLLAGWMRDEATSGIVKAPKLPTLESLRAMANSQFGERADEFLKAYVAANDEEAVRVTEDFAGDQFEAYSTWAWLEGQVKTGGAPVYRYYFQLLPPPGDPNNPPAYGAFHTDDIEYVFGNLNARKSAEWRPEDYKLSDLIQTYWTNFAKTGNPNGSGLPNWPAYDAAGNWQVMHLDANSAAQPDHHRDRYLFLLQAWSR
jgi:para-nitrobenzyl esterase